MSNIPAIPVLGGFPERTDQSSITLFGTKSPNTSIAINDQLATDFDCLTTWAADVALSDGTNSLEIFGINKIGAAGPPVTTQIEKVASLPPPPPSSKVPGKPVCDFNGDGFDDLIIGSYENDADGKNNVGRVFIYTGGPSGPDANVDVVLTGEAQEDHFGISVACAGDVNGDGFSDLVVGAFLNDAAGQDAGRAYLFFGGAGLKSKNAAMANIVLSGQAPGDQFGLSVAAGDVNGDGFDDVMVGAYRNNGGGTGAGRAYIYFGGVGMDVLPDVVLTGEEAGDQFGIRVAWAGDVNGDTYDDVIIGADRADVGDLFDAGKAYIFYGSPSMAGRNAALADVILQGATEDEAFASVAGAGDLNMDGFSDVVVGASAYQTPGSGEQNCTNFVDDDNDQLVDRKDSDCHLGRAYIFLGGPSLRGTISAANASYILERPLGSDGFGFSVASAGDVNGDGFSDLLVGAFLTDRPIAGTLVEDAGTAYLYFGSDPFHPSQMGRLPNVAFFGEASLISNTPISGQFGFSLSGAGKLNNDDLDDIVIGAYLMDLGVFAPQTDLGRVYIFYGSTAFSTPIEAKSVCSIPPPPTGLCITGSQNPPNGPDSGFGISVQ